MATDLVYYLLLALLQAPLFAQDSGDTGVVDTGVADTGLDVDADRDGFSVRDGDCDDQRARINPDALEVCYDHRDNDCDGFFDEECDVAVWQAPLRGGGACTGGGGLGTSAMLFLLLPGLWIRREWS